MFLTIFRRFPTIFRRIPKIFTMLSEGRKNDSENFPNFSENLRKFPKIAEEDPKIFRLNINNLWLIFSIETWQTLRADWSKMISHMCRYHFYSHTCDTIFYRFATTPYTTPVYIIKYVFPSFSKLIQRLYRVGWLELPVWLFEGSKIVSTTTFWVIRNIKRFNSFNVAWSQQ